MSGPEDPRAWVEKADEDLLTIENNLAAARTPWSAVCYHAQQVAEKMLKALIVSYGRTPARTHDLIALWDDCLRLGAPVEPLQGDCELLLRYAVSMRYPGEVFRPTAEHGRAAYEAAVRVRATVLPLLPEEPR